MPLHRSARRNLPLLVMHVHEAAISLFRPILKHFGLTDQQWRVLRSIWQSESGQEPGQIAESCKLLKPSLTGILSRLEQMELVQRRHSEIDQRRQTIRLTKRGAELAAQIYPLIEAQYRLIEEGIGEGTLARMQEELDDMLVLLQRPIGRIALDGVTTPALRPRGPREETKTTLSVRREDPARR